MATLSPVRAAVPTLVGLRLLHRGKVRDTYELELGYMLIVVTDAISIYDFVLNALVPEKGYVLAAMSHFWFKYLEQNGFRTHMVAVGDGIDPYLPSHLRGDIDLQRRAMVVRKLTMVPVEFIKRTCLTGSVLSGYKETGCVYGIKLPSGLQDGDALPEQLFTPTDKAEDDHDKPVNAQMVRDTYPEEALMFYSAFDHVYEKAKSRDILMPDGKGEIGRDKNGVIRIGDEFGTPDSSRFWDYEVWAKSRKSETRKAPPSFDKQIVRDWGKKHGIDKYDVKNPEHVKMVHAMHVPEKLIEQTSKCYRYIFWCLTGKTLEQYTRDELEVMIPLKKRKVAIVAGSESDMPTVASVIQHEIQNELPSSGSHISLSVHIISCHRNPRDLDTFAHTGCDGADAVICVGGMALALPGVLDALLYDKGWRIPVVGVALGFLDQDPGKAAVLSIEQLPGAHVLMDSQSQRAYTGWEGVCSALRRVCNQELPPVMDRQKKPALYDVDFRKYLKT